MKEMRRGLIGEMRGNVGRVVRGNEGRGSEEK